MTYVRVAFLMQFCVGRKLQDYLLLAFFKSSRYFGIVVEYMDIIVSVATSFLLHPRQTSESGRCPFRIGHRMCTKLCKLDSRNRWRRMGTCGRAYLRRTCRVLGLVFIQSLICLCVCVCVCFFSLEAQAPKES